MPSQRSKLHREVRRGRRPARERVVLDDDARTVLYSAARAMKMLAVDRGLFYRLVRAGVLPPRKWGTVLVGGLYSGWDVGDDSPQYFALDDLRAYHERRAAWLQQHGRPIPRVSPLIVKAITSGLDTKKGPDSAAV